MSTTKPEVVYLPAIFRSIRQGQVRIPAFQRGFVWEAKQIIELLESVYRSYPIGSLLFWQIDVGQMLTDKRTDNPFPHPDVQGTVDFVLDGMQRASSLFGAFHAPTNPGRRDAFDISFDLKQQKFVHSTEASRTAISLRVLFSPRELLAEQARLGILPDGAQLVDRTLELQRVFQEYLLPVVRIGDRTVDEVVEIFERVNSTGTRLSAVDFMRALTWSSDFDLSQQLSVLKTYSEKWNFDLTQDTLAKIVALSLGVVPIGARMLELRSMTAKALTKGISDTRQALQHALGYLTTKFGIGSYDFVPYEGQVLVLASLARARKADIPDWFAKWYWTVSFAEAMQGRPDDTIARQALGATSDPDAALTEHFSLDPLDLRTRTIRKGAALGMSIVAALASQPAASVISGEAIDREEFLAGYELDCLGTVFTKEEVDAVTEPPPRGNRVIANIVLLAAEERRPVPKSDSIKEAIVNLARTKKGRAALLSQCIDEVCVAAVEENDAGAFLDARAQLLYQLAAELAGALD